MNNKIEKYLPIGTVCMLKGGTKRVMIIGFATVSNDDPNTIYDYSGCMYPEGVISSDQTAVFNHDQIAQVYYIGYSDEENKNFQVQLKNLLSKSDFNNTKNISLVSQNLNSNDKLDAKIENSSIPPIGPGLPGYVAPLQAQPTETTLNEKNENPFNINFN